MHTLQQSAAKLSVWHIEPFVAPRRPVRLPGFDALALPRLTPAPMQLTRREIEVLAWIARGRTDWQIAEILYVSEKTVNYHVQRAKAKLGVSSRTHAVAAAVVLGYGPAFDEVASVSVVPDETDRSRLS